MDPRAHRSPYKEIKHRLYCVVRYTLPRVTSRIGHWSDKLRRRRAPPGLILYLELQARPMACNIVSHWLRRSQAMTDVILSLIGWKGSHAAWHNWQRHILFVQVKLRDSTTGGPQFKLSFRGFLLLYRGILDCVIQKWMVNNCKYRSLVELIWFHRVVWCYYRGIYHNLTIPCRIWSYMMTSSNGNIFRVTGPLCGEFTGPGEFPIHKGQWRGALIFSLICVWINGWVNNREAGDLRRYRGHYDVNVILVNTPK